MLGEGGCTKSDEFSEKFQRGVVIFNPKVYIAGFENFKQGFLSMKLIQKSNFRLQGMFLAVQDSSKGDIVTHSLTETLLILAPTMTTMTTRPQ